MSARKTKPARRAPPPAPPPAVSPRLEFTVEELSALSLLVRKRRNWQRDQIAAGVGLGLPADFISEPVLVAIEGKLLRAGLPTTRAA